MAEAKPPMTLEQIQKINPRYKGKPENFKKNFKANKPGNQKLEEKPKPQRQPTIPPPTKVEENAAAPSKQRNDPILDEAIFGIDVSIREDVPLATFTPTFARLPWIVKEVYQNFPTDDGSINKKLTPGMLNYYAVALLWARLIDLKAKRAQTPLSQTELDFRRYFTETEYNVPQPIAVFLRSIGTTTDERKKEYDIQDAVLPVTVVGNQTGYYSNVINVENHNLYEEIPCMGIVGDVLQAEASAEANPVPAIPVLPPNTAATENLCGYVANIPIRKEEVRQVLNSNGIFANRFAENIPNTRFNINLVNYVSDVLVDNKTFRVDKINITTMSVQGSRVQLIKTTPSTTENQAVTLWTANIVQPRSVSASDVTQIGASYFMGFQTMKETIQGSNSNWCCVVRTDQPGQIPEGWHANRNMRRALPQNFEHTQFSALCDSQQYRTTAIIRRMLHAKR